MVDCIRWVEPIFSGDELDMDPRWMDLQRERGRTDGEQLALELAKALGGRADVKVER